MKHLATIALPAIIALMPLTVLAVDQIIDCSNTEIVFQYNQSNIAYTCAPGTEGSATPVNPDAKTGAAMTPDQTTAPYYPLSPIPILATENGDSLTNYLNSVFTLTISVAAVLAVIMIVWGGFQYMTNEAAEAKDAGKKTIQQALFGLILLLGSWLILNVIDPNILNLSLFEKSLETVQPDATGGSGDAGTSDQNIQPDVINGVGINTPNKLMGFFTGDANCPATVVLQEQQQYSMVPNTQTAGYVTSSGAKTCNVNEPHTTARGGCCAQYAPQK